MGHINYFEPYESKSVRHEDQLTRAFLVVLRYSPSALIMFYDYVARTLINKSTEQGKPVQILSVSQLDMKSMDFRTQVSNVEEAFRTEKVISVCITDKTFNQSRAIAKSDRSARYDGIIYLSSNVALIIENKPDSYNVWEEQLNPSKDSLPDGVEIIPIAAIIEWKEIIKSLNSLIDSNLVSRAENEIIKDFLDFVDDHFASLNPYDKIAYCKGNTELVKRRVKTILENELLLKEDDLDYHQGWACYCIKTGLKEVPIIGFPIESKEDHDWELLVEINFGDNSSQSQELYRALPDSSKIEELKKKGWLLRSNFHIFMVKHLVWLETPKKTVTEYLKYWYDHTTQIKTYSQKELRALLDDLRNKQIIEITAQNELDLKKQIFDTSRDRLSIAPGLELKYEISSIRAAELDAKNALGKEIKRVICEGLTLLGDKSQSINSKLR